MSGVIFRSYELYWSGDATIAIRFYRQPRVHTREEITRVAERFMLYRYRNRSRNYWLFMGFVAIIKRYEEGKCLQDAKPLQVFWIFLTISYPRLVIVFNCKKSPGKGQKLMINDY